MILARHVITESDLKVVYFYVMTHPTSRIPDTHRLHLAKDGHTAIVRFLGGRVSAAQWEQLADLAVDMGDGTIHLTSRGAVQLRGIKDSSAFTEVVQNNAVLPASMSCPQVLASAAVSKDLLEGVGTCVQNVRNDRLLIGLDDGSGDVLINRPDFGFVSATDGQRIVLGGELTQFETTDPAKTLSILLEEWNSAAGDARRVHRHQDFISRAHELLESMEWTRTRDQLSVPVPRSPKVGWIQHSDSTKVTLGLGVPLATISSKIAQILGAVGAETTITGWPSLLIHDLDEGSAEAVAKVLAPQGLVFDAESPWLRVTTCVGTQGCSRALSDVRTDAQQYLASASALVGRTHFSGCSHRCGRPADTAVDYIATGDGEYEVEEND